MSIDLSLDRIRVLLSHFPVPYTRPTIHVAGTNGKGSVCAYVSSIIAATPNLRVGRFNSPHLLSPTDGICIQNKPISRDLFMATRAVIKGIDEEYNIGASLFERFTCVALLIFERAPVDVVVLEVGMGGRLDATNVVPDECILVSALTSVDLDHQAFLGDTVEKIAKEKAAISRAGKPFVLGPQVYPEVEDVARSVVEEVGGDMQPACSVTPVDWDESLDGPARPTRAGIEVPLVRPVQITIPGILGYVRALLPLHGEHQFDNLKTAAGIVSALLTHPSCQRANSNFREVLTPAVISRGIQATRWPGRLSYHTISLPSDKDTPQGDSRIPVLVDGAHNPASAAALAAYISSTLAGSLRRPLALTYILALSHSPPKTPAQTLRPLFAIHDRLAQGREVRLRAALLPFTPPAGMPWISSVPPSDMRAAVESLVPAGASVEILESSSDVAQLPTLAEPERPGPPRTEHVEEALRWAASRRREGEDSVVVLAGSLYLVADFYRLLMKLGQSDEIWGSNQE